MGDTQYDLGEVKALSETKKAVLLTGGVLGSRKEWIPKSQTRGTAYKSYYITEWLAKKTNLIHRANRRHQTKNVCQSNAKPSRFVMLMRLAKTKRSDTT